MALSKPLFTPAELRTLAQDSGPEYTGRSRRALRWCADVLEAADAVVQAARRDEALIRQPVERKPLSESDANQLWNDCLKKYKRPGPFELIREFCARSNSAE